MVGDYKILHDRAEKTVRYKTPQGKEVCLIREVYMRDDIPCKCAICTKSECKHDGRLLSSDIKNYILIDGMEALNYWEVFEFTEIKGIVLTLSTINYVQQQAPNKRPYKRIQMALEDPVQSCILFDNEFHSKCFRPPIFDESAHDFTSRMNWVASHWYQSHLGKKASVVLITSNKNVIAKYASKTIPIGSANHEIMVLSLSEYLEAFHPNLIAARLLLDSLQASLQNEATTRVNTTTIISDDPREAISAENVVPKAPAPGSIYPEHLPESALLAGLRSGQFIRGILRVSRFRATTEAMVALTDASVIKHQPELKEALATRSEIAVHGVQHRNRAVDGDVVVIRLLPRDQWAAVSSNVTPSESNAAQLVETVVGASECKQEEERVDFTPPVNVLPCGFVIGILNRNWRDYVCTYVPSGVDGSEKLSEVGWVLVTPWDRRIPRIRLHTTQASKLAQERFVVRIDAWDAKSTYPHGHFVQSLGRIGDLETETQTLLIEHSLTVRAFSDAQLNELAPYAAIRPWRVNPAEVKRRRDLRPPAVSGNSKSEDVFIFSIDPQGCQDVDDAISVKWLEPIVAEDGSLHRHIQLGVHIADVTYFVPSGGFVDAEARRRSTSIYLADRRYEMLPGLLSDDLCSLWSGVDRYAVSVLWEIDMDAFDVLDVWFGRTVIRSSYKLTYELAQRLHDLPPPDSSPASAEQLISKMGGLKKLSELIPEFKNFSKEHAVTELIKLKNSIKVLADLASTIRSRRVARGGLELDSTEVTVRFSDPQTRSGKLEDLVPKEPLEMHGTVAELMIFANHWVARRCLEAFPERSCLRRHPPPKSEFFDELKQCAASRGFELDTQTNRSLSESLSKADDPSDPEVKRVLLQMATRAMTNALYFSTGADNLTREQFAHYGLALNLYTHFTSPIRRYADMIVHRVLLTALGDCRSAISGNPSSQDILSQSTTCPTVTFGEEHLFTPEELSTVCRHMNEQHWAAQQVQRASMELFQALFFRDRPEDDPIRTTDGIICQLRGNNGFVVMVSRFGIRGAVCIQDHNGQVAWAMQQSSQSPGRIQWMPPNSGYEVVRVHPTEGRDCGHLEVRDTRSNAVQRYRLFDHVTVSIHVSESVTHGLGLRLQLVSGPMKSAVSVPTSASAAIEPDATKKDLKSDLIESVQAIDAERRRKRAALEEMALEDESAGLEQDELISKLHEPSSLYTQMHKILRRHDPSFATEPTN